VGDASENLREELAAHAPTCAPFAAGELTALCDALGVRVRPGSRVAVSVRDVRVARRIASLVRACGGNVRIFALRGGPSRRLVRRSVVRLTWHPLAPDASRRAWRRRVAWSEGYLAGALMAAGYLADPRKGYSLEWYPRRVGQARLIPGLRRALRRLGVAFGEAPGRRGGSRLYVKGGDAVSLVLRRVGAVASLLRLEDARSFRSVRGSVHRAVNGETANLARSARASVRQADWARRALAGPGAGELPPALREVAALRVRRPTASLGELAQALGIARSSVHGRMRRLKAWVERQEMAPPGIGAGSNTPGPSTVRGHSKRTGAASGRSRGSL